MSSQLTPKQQSMKDMLHAEFRRYGSASEDEIAEMYPAMRKQPFGSPDVIRFGPEDSLVSAVISYTRSGIKRFLFLSVTIRVVPDEDTRELLIRRHLNELHDIIREYLSPHGGVRFCLGGPPGFVSIEESLKHSGCISVTAGGVIE